MPYYWRLSGFYLFYFASLGALVPYWSFYLKSLSFSALEIGQLMAIIMATKIISPNIWGWIADHTGMRMRIVRIGCLLGAVAFAGVFLGSGFWWLAFVMMLFSFFWNATLPQFEATTFNHLQDKIHRYSSIRLWGSVGFIVSVVFLGALLERFGMILLPVTIIILMFGIWFASLSVPEQAAGHLHIEHETLRSVFKRPEVLALIAVCFFMQASHGSYYTFFTIYMKAHDYSGGIIGVLWALGVLAEIGVFLVMYRLIPRFGLRALLIFSLLMTTLRWLLVGWFVDSLPVMVLAQLLHAFTFGMYHAAAIQLFHHHFKGPHQGRGQAVYSSMSFGAGGAAGSLISGYTWDSLGPATTYTIAAVISAIGLVIAWRFITTRQT
jgi:PPP family 3-phenylpropionic acid transporter